MHLIDASHITDASRYISLVLLSLRAMLMLELPHVNVLSKVDLLGEAAGAKRDREDGEEDEEGDDPGADDEGSETSSIRAAKSGLGELSPLSLLGTQAEMLSPLMAAFNLDYYTEVQDLSYLLGHLNATMGPRRSAKFSQLNERICELVEDFGLVSFETLAVEDKRSMLRLMRVLDKAVGYVYVRSGSDGAQERELPDADDAEMAAYEPGSFVGTTGSRRGTAASAASLFTVADTGEPVGWGSAADVQERWVDHQDAWEAYEAKERQELEKLWRDNEIKERKAPA